jgi:hydrogenase nickel insertion protein HypA
MQQLSDLAQQHNASKILTVRLTVGQLSGIVIDSFEFGFEIMAKENPLTQETRLIITAIEPDLLCSMCGTTVSAKPSPPACRKCGTTSTRPVGGDELMLTQVEME